MSAEGPIPYLDRVRTYYQALGYGTPYVWARVEKVPFRILTKPLKGCRVAIVTTAAPFQPGKGDQGPGAAYNGAAKFFSVYSGSTATTPDLRISHIAIDRAHTHAADMGAYFPLAAARRAVAAGRIGALTEHFFGLPTNRSQRTTVDVDCVELVARCLADRADVAVLVANCPVCHQSCALAANTLEEAGIASVIMGCARDIVEHVGAPRLLFSDFPLGNGAGRPHDVASQDETLGLGLDLLENATAPRTTWLNPLRWSADSSWKTDYCNIEKLSTAEIAARRMAFDAAKAQRIG